MKIYVAGASKELARCQFWIDECREAGFEVTQDWTIAVLEIRIGTTLTAEERRKCARDDLDGVLSASVLWMLVPSNASVGSWIEFGYALALIDHQATHAKISWAWGHVVEIVMSPPKPGNIFAELPGVRSFANDEDAFDYLKELAKGGT